MSAKKKNITAKIFSEAGHQIAEMFNTPSGYAAILRASHNIEMMEIDQPKEPRSAKRKTEKHKAIRAGLYAAKYPFMRDETIDPIIDKALASGSLSEVLSAISKGAEMLKEKQSLTIFARHVIVALTVALHFMEKENTIPTKNSVREKTKAIFTQNKWSGFQEEPARWTEIFNAAGLTDLPQAITPPSSARHGDNYSERLKKPKATPSIFSDQS